MKKIFMSIIAIAAMTLAMTSCNKEEVVNGTEFYGTLMNAGDIKTHFAADGSLFWDENDRVIVIDRNGYAGYYHGNVQSDGNIRLVFERAAKKAYNENNGPLTAYYPTSNNLKDHIWISASQKTTAGEPSNLPLYGEGTIDNFQWICPAACLALQLTGDNILLDSVSLTTDQYINGYFKIDLTSTNILTYGAKNTPNRGHGTKTNTVSFANNQPLMITGTSQEVCIVLPAGTYQEFNITFYSNGHKYVLRNNNPLTFASSLTTSPFRNMEIALNSANFTTPVVKGTNNAQYNIAGASETPRYVVFAQGNIEFIGRQQYWRFADNQWDFRGNGQNTSKADSDLDRDLFAWGANGYNVAGHSVAGYGNGIAIWGVGYTGYNYYDGTTLTGTNDWGSNVFVNANKQQNEGWRTLTATEMRNILANHNPRKVTLMGKDGIVIFPAGVDPCDNNTPLTKREWNALEADGCIFFVADKYRTATRSIASTMSYFWLNNATESTASALVIDPANTDGYYIEPAADKLIGGYVRLVKDVQ